MVTQLQSLPFGDLRWDDFEKLCLRLARADHEVEDARRYGIPGQDQYGIDLFARSAGTGGYTVYQCKRVERFSPSDISAAVDDFLTGPWATRADRYVFCKRASLWRRPKSRTVWNRKESAWPGAASPSRRGMPTSWTS